MTETSVKKYSSGPVKYKGFVIHAWKVTGLPWYYARIYSADMTTPEYRVEREGESPTRDAIIDCAKFEIDQGLLSPAPSNGEK